MTTNRAKFCVAVLAAAFGGVPMFSAFVTARAQEDNQSDLRSNAISLYRTWPRMNQRPIVVSGSDAAFYG